MIKNVIREEEVKNIFAKKYFQEYDCTKILGDIDFCVSIPNTNNDIFGLQSFLWAEAKKEKNTIVTSLVQLILTIGKARTFDTYLPPAFLGSFDTKEIGIIPYNKIYDIFYVNDFNWNVAPSNHNTREFKQIQEKVTDTLNKDFIIFKFGIDDKDFKKYLKSNFVIGRPNQSKIRIDKNNFISIYNKWLTTVKPTIDINWDDAKKKGIIDGDFYLADLLSIKNESLSVKLDVLLKTDHYVFDKVTDEVGLLFRTTQFTDRQKSHNQFWNKYERPPKKVFWDFMVLRRDLLVPQDIRERKGSYFTPQIWVELSQKYLTAVLGEDWQDEYYIWDCAAGTGNLLTGLTDKYRIWASTVDKQDVDVMHERIETMNNNSKKGDGSNLLHDHVFKFDFLNDDFSKLPNTLKDILDDPEKRRKLVVYINPPYAEASDKKTLDGKEGKRGVEQSLINIKYAVKLGQSNAEMFAQFFIRIFYEINGCILADFSKLKIIQGQHFIDFRRNFRAKLEKIFIVPADTFDNVKGKFPIGFMIWDTSKDEQFENVLANVYDRNGILIGEKEIIAYDDNRYINDWIKPFRADKNDKLIIGKFPFKGNDFQNQNMIAIVHNNMAYNKEAGQFLINKNNLINASIYYAVRHCILATWINDRDQFLFPNEGWQTDIEFKNNCLAYTLFNNNIQSKYGINYWIPFTENDLDAREKFETNFMTDFIKGKLGSNINIDLFNPEINTISHPLIFSHEAMVVFNSGRQLYRYYHKQPNCNVNASLYDIREHFQGRNYKGKMNNKSEDDKYNELISNLRTDLNSLAKHIEPCIYEYGFLRRGDFH